jgi:hypothetical protein
MHVELRKYGSIGTTGRAFEDFGSATPAVLHGVEGVFTPAQLKMIVSDSQSKLTNSFTKNIRTLIEDNTKTQFEPIASAINKSLTSTLEFSKQLNDNLKSQRDETVAMKNLLSDMVSAINKSNGHLDMIRRTV